MGKKEKIPPPGNKKDEYTNFWNKGKWKANMLKNLLEIASKNMRPQGAQIVCNALAKNKWVTNVDMSHNNFVDEGATEVAQLLKVNAALLIVNVACNGISDIGGVALASSFIPTPSPTGQPGVWNRTLTQLNLACNNLKDDTAIALGMAIKYCRDITKLDVSHNKIGPSGMKALFGAIRFQNNLTIICHHNDPSDDGVIGLCDVLRLHGVPGAHAQLNLSVCDVGKAGAEAIEKLIYTNNHVQDLNLSFNTLGDLGAQAICRGLIGKHIIRSVFLQHNLLTDECGEDIGRVLEGNIESLTTLVISYNEIGDRGGVAIARALLKNTTLSNLYLNHNRIGAATAEVLIEVIKTTKTLKTLDVRNTKEKNNLKENVRVQMMDAQKTHNSTMRLYGAGVDAGEPGEEFLKKLLEYQSTMKQRAQAGKR